MRTFSPALASSSRREDLAGLLGVAPAHAAQLVLGLERHGLAQRFMVAGRGRLALTDRGLSLLARRDRSSVGAALKRWSAAPAEADAPFEWRNVSGSRSRQLLRHLDHTEAVHGFMAALAGQARRLGWEVAQLDPPFTTLNREASQRDPQGVVRR